MSLTPETASRHAARPPTIDALTGIRAFGSAWVLLVHLEVVLAAVLPSALVLRPWLHGGTLSVDIFFILSGFVLSYNYAEVLRAPDRRRYGAYVFARFARIYPVHLVTLVVAAVFVVLPATGPARSPAATVGDFATNLFLVQGLSGREAWNAPAWSVGCEVLAYVLFPLVAGWLLRLPRRTALVVAVVVVVAELVVLFEIGWTRTALPPVSLVRIAGGFALGCLLWVVWRHGVRAHGGWDLVAFAMLVLTFAWLGLAPGGMYIFVAVPMLAVFVLAVASSTGPVRRVLASRVMEWGGRVSYSLYLTHVLVIFGVAHVLEPTAFRTAPLLARLAVLAAYVVAVIAVAALTHHLVEEPARRWLRDRAAARRRRSAVGGAAREVPAVMPDPGRPAGPAMAIGPPERARAASVTPPSVR